jgi:hypothetical protein
MFQIAIVSYSEGLKVCRSDENELWRFLHLEGTERTVHYAATLSAELFDYTPSFVLNLDEYNAIEFRVCETRLIDDVSVTLYTLEVEVVKEPVIVCAEPDYPVSGLHLVFLSCVL